MLSQFSFSKPPHMIMAETKCVMWNCSGVLPTETTKEKMIFLDTQFKNDFDILILIETHHKEENNISPLLHRLKSTHHIIHSFATNDDTYAGMLIFIRNSFDILQQNELIQGRFVNIKIKNTHIQNLELNDSNVPKKY